MALCNHLLPKFSPLQRGILLLLMSRHRGGRVAARLCIDVVEAYCETMVTTPGL
jgi:hypothetical protein